MLFHIIRFCSRKDSKKSQQDNKSTRQQVFFVYKKNNIIFLYVRELNKQLLIQLAKKNKLNEVQNVLIQLKLKKDLHFRLKKITQFHTLLS